MQRATLIFHLILLKQRFCFLLARLPCFRIVFLRTTFFSVFVTKLHFGNSILPRKFFDLLATELGYLQLYVTKKSVSFFLCLKYAGFSFIAGKTSFGLFSVKIGLFLAILDRKNVFCQCAASHFDFYLISLKITFPFIFGQVTLFSVLYLQEQPFPFFRT